MRTSEGRGVRRHGRSVGLDHLGAVQVKTVMAEGVVRGPLAIYSVCSPGRERRTGGRSNKVT